MEIGLNLPAVPTSDRPITVEELRTIALAAEERGFAELYLGEHVVLFDAPASAYPATDDGEPFFPATAPLPDPVVTLAFLAACTSRIRLATGVMLLPQRNPVYAAKHIATLDWLSGGRVDCGIGVGWSRDEVEACGVPWAERGARAEEYVAVMRTLWTDPLSSFEGRFYSLKPCRQYPKPVQQPHPPIWFGGWSDAALARTARVGNGWYGFELTPDVAAKRIAKLRQMLADRGRSPDSVKICLARYDDQPSSAADLRAYREAGADQFVFTPTQAGLTQILKHMDFLAEEFIARR